MAEVAEAAESQRSEPAADDAEWDKATQALERARASFSQPKPPPTASSSGDASPVVGRSRQRSALDRPRLLTAELGAAVPAVPEEDDAATSAPSPESSSAMDRAAAIMQKAKAARPEAAAKAQAEAKQSAELQLKRLREERELARAASKLQAVQRGRSIRKEVATLRQRRAARRSRSESISAVGATASKLEAMAATLEALMAERDRLVEQLNAEPAPDQDMEEALAMAVKLVERQEEVDLEIAETEAALTQTYDELTRLSAMQPATPATPGTQPDPLPDAQQQASARTPDTSEARSPPGKTSRVSFAAPAKGSSGGGGGGGAPPSADGAPAAAEADWISGLWGANKQPAGDDSAAAAEAPAADEKEKNWFGF